MLILRAVSSLFRFLGLSAAREILVKEFIQIFRDPRMRGVIFLMPVIQLLVFGYAVTTDVNQIPTVIFDLDNSLTSRDLVSRFADSGYFKVLEYVDRSERVTALMNQGKAGAVISIQKGFENQVRGGRTAPVQLIVDGTDSNTAGIVLNYSARIVSRFSEELLAERRGSMTGAESAGAAALLPVRLESRAWFNENLESRNFYIPGVIAIIVLLITLMLTGMAVVREKEIGTIEQIMVTPIRSWEFILGKTIPFALIGFADVVLITVIGVLWFQVPIRGNLLLLFGATGLYLLTTLAIGLFISTVSQTQQQAMMSTFFFYFPAVLLSGFMFPIANMPEAVQWLTYLNPLRYFLVVVRGIFLKGVGPSVLWPQMLALALMGVITLWLAARRFHKTMA
jgi:ABC-2 type transport system permease protein